MKTLLMGCLTVLLMAVNTCSGQEDEGLRMVILSDTHLMAPELLVEDGEAMERYIAYDRKMLRESPQLMEEAVEAVLAERPHYVLVVGDLTKDGETRSHLMLRDRYLSRLRAAGIGVLVVPGNHDVDNPHAVEFRGSETQRVSTPGAGEFAAIYEDYGYGQAIARDTASLSYVVELTDDVRLLCLDACRYEENSYEENTCVTGGRLKDATLDFIREQARAAKSSGCRLLAMMHHGIVEHWTWQSRAMSDYLVAKWKKRVKLLRKLGVEVVFTGHFHANDISERGGLYDIETGSLVSYPSPYRLAELRGDTLRVETRYLQGTGLDMQLPEGMTLRDYSLGYAKEGICSIVSSMFPESCPQSVRLEACSLLGEAYAAHLAGDEQMPAGAEEEIDAVAKQLRPYSWKLAYIFKHITRYLWTDLEPADEEIEIVLD